MRFMFFLLVLLALMPSWAATAEVTRATAKTGGLEEGLRFIENGDGTISDVQTGLMWPRDANMVKTRLPLQAAKDYVNAMNGGDEENFGYTDWRIPSLSELLSIIDKNSFYPSLPPGHRFTNVQNNYYWTSSGGFNIVGFVWMVDMASGNVKYDYISYCNFMSLLPVRGVARTLPSADYKLSPSELDLSLESLACKDNVKPPKPPVEIAAVAVSSSEIALSWRRAPEDTDIVWYNIYEDKTFLKSVPTEFASFIGLKPGASKCFRLSSFNNAGLESGPSENVCSTTWKERATGTVWSSGINQFGQLGDGTSDDRRSLARVNGISDIVDIAAGVEHVIALRSDSTVWTWGRNQKGQLGDGTVKDSHKPVMVKGLVDVVDVAAGMYHSLALKTDGTVWAWGRNYYGQLGTGDRADRLVPVRVKGMTDAIAIASGWYHSMALRSDGTVWVWGWNLKGQLGNDSTADSYEPTSVVGVMNAIEISAGMYHSMALKSDGTVLTWGWNEYGQLGTGNTVDSLLPVLLRGVTDISHVSGGMHHSMAIKSDGKVLGWGKNEYGQLGVKGISQSSSPVVISDIDDISAVAAGANHTVALKADGSVWLWGWNYGTDIRSSLPQQISVISGISKVAAGVNFTAIVKGD